MTFSFDLSTVRKRRVAGALLVAGVITAGAGGAATLHRFTVSQAAGSGGATAFVQGSATGSALQGEVASTANTNLKIPFAVLGDYDATGSTFGIGVAGVSTTGYAVGAESFGTNPTVEVLAEGNGDAFQSFTSSTSTSSAYAVDALAQGAGDGVDGIAENGGWGGYFYSQSGIGLEGYSGGSGGNPTSSAIYGIQAGNASAGYFIASGTGNAVRAVAQTLAVRAFSATTRSAAAAFSATTPAKPWSASGIPVTITLRSLPSARLRAPGFSRPKPTTAEVRRRVSTLMPVRQIVAEAQSHRIRPTSR